MSRVDWLCAMHREREREKCIEDCDRPPDDYTSECAYHPLAASGSLETERRLARESGR